MEEFEEFYKDLVKNGNFPDDCETCFHLFSGYTNSWWSYNMETYFPEAKEKFDYEHIRCEEGGETEGEYCYGVCRVGDKYYKAEWIYFSYSGSGYDNIRDTIREVKPVTKTITVYE